MLGSAGARHFSNVENNALGVQTKLEEFYCISLKGQHLVSHSSKPDASRNLTSRAISRSNIKMSDLKALGFQYVTVKRHSTLVRGSPFFV